MSSQPVSAVHCSQCGESFPPSEVTMLAGMVVCATCKPALVRRMQEGANPQAVLQPKGFWIRFCGKFIDGLLMGIVFIPMYIYYVAPMMRAAILSAQTGKPAPPPVMGSAFWLLELGALTLSLVYNTFFVGRFEATPGKMAIGARVVSSDGSSMTYMHAFGRAAAELVSGLTMTVGYVIAAFDSKQKRALHDYIAGTRVVAK